ncbi:ScyD/ScyE family protein [Micromonospora sp. NPDC005806]|uniref:ScyD/ScyE family protein n=1 Tax=Micromonospora sp. NPDC005806 TaxID=3364234 RepID=UPI0036945853
MALTGGLLIPAASAQASVPSYEFASPAFGLATAPDGSLLVADAGAGIVELRNGVGTLAAPLPGVTDVAPIGRGDMFAVTGGGEDASARKLFRVSGGATREIADLGAFEAAVNPDGEEIDSNPYDVAALGGGKALVADAGANALLVVDQQGNVDWVATLPDELASTANAKQLAGCPAAPPEFAFVCTLPEMIPAQGVATSVAVGPDGAYYVSELKGFPGPIGASKVWRVEPGTRHAECGTSPACTVVADGFTSIVDLAFAPNGTLYVVEIDEASFLAVELGSGTSGTVNACSPGSWTCTPVATGLSMPMAATVGKDGTVYALTQGLLPGAAKVIALS